MDREQLPRASDFLVYDMDFGDCVSVEDVENVELILLDFEFRDTPWGEALIITAKDEDKNLRILTWSKVLIEQAKRLQSHLPVVGCIERIKRYWTFV